MITAIVNFPLPQGTSLADAAALFRGTAPNYRGMKGLARKYYLFDEKTRTGGGCYLFDSRADAEATFNAEWRARIRQKYGSEPDIRFFESPVIVDNRIGEIVEA